MVVATVETAVCVDPSGIDGEQINFLQTAVQYRSGNMFVNSCGATATVTQPCGSRRLSGCLALSVPPDSFNHAAEAVLLNARFVQPSASASSSSARIPNARMLAMRSGLPVSSVMTLENPGPVTAIQVWPDLSP